MSTKQFAQSLQAELQLNRSLLALIVPTCMSALTITASLAQSSTREPAATKLAQSTGTQTFGSASSGTATSEPGLLVRPGGAPVRSRETNVLYKGKADTEEQAVIDRLAPGANPREMIAAFVYKLRHNHSEEPPISTMGNLVYFHDNAVSQVLPAKLFYILRFRQWPVGYNLPPPLSNNNIFCFERESGLKLITNQTGLQQLFENAVHDIQDDATARNALVAWLTLFKELAQDGMYKFSIPNSEIQLRHDNAGTICSGKAVVDPTGGNFGEIEAALSFAKNGSVTNIQQTVNLRAGIRPICQSTKLLDADPIVRKMAEQDLLIMGSAAKPYLDEQKEKVSPELKKAIDRIWERILIEGR